MACHMKLLREKINNFWSLVQLVLHMGVTMAAVFAISTDLGVTLMYPLIFLAMLLASGVSWWWMGAAAACAGGCMTKMPKEGTFSSVVSQKVSQRSCNVLKNQCFKSCSRNSKKAQFCKELSFFILENGGVLVILVG
jgi:cell division protein FtsW (lipid II flippase)